MIEMGESAVAYDVNQISEKVRETLAGCPEVVAALLMGSCSRGEETYFINGRGERELLSDYEMLIIVHDKMDTKVSDNKLRLLASELKGQSSSPCFELEWSYKTEHQIKKLDKRFIFFEARESACTIYGNKSAIELFPVINIKNLNFCELNTVIIHRLYHVLRDCLNTDEHYQQYLIARNTLDIPTAVLPLCGILQSSYGRRNMSFSEYALQYGFSEELMVRLTDYLQMKKDYNADQYKEYSLEFMKKQFVADMKMLYEFQKRQQHNHAFRKNKRLFISAVYRRNIEMLKISLCWEKVNESLYQRMIQMLEKDDVSGIELRKLQDEMFRLFNYR